METQQQDRPSLRINISLLGAELDEERAKDVLLKNKGAVRYRDAYCVLYPIGEVWIFEYGVMVCWNLSEDDRQHLYHDLKSVIAPSVHLTTDQAYNYSEQYSYRITADKKFRIHHDFLDLPTDDRLCRLALSHAFAQSTKLGFFEEKAQNVIKENGYISRELAAKGKITLSRKQLSKLRGILFDTSSDITLHFNLLDTPEFFWDYPELEDYYHILAKYLDLIPRIDILNKKLSTIHEMLDMLAAEQYHKHSSFLEWIIIVLIAVDIAVYFIG